MKRLVLSIIGTVSGLIALLSFKTESQPTATAAGSLPTASLGAGSSSSSTPGSGSSSTTSSSSSPAGGSTSAPSTSSASATRARTYLGSAITTRYGVIQVKVTVRGKKITNVTFGQLTAFDGRSAQINSGAAPQLLHETVKAQSANIDTVSGATYTSDGYRQSLQSALDKAGL